MSKRSWFVLILLTVALGLGSTLTVADEKPPTGACTISVYGVSPTCTSPMTEKSCNDVAKRVGGTASWEKGKSCPKK
jgi:hypothetical protein